MVNQEQYSIKQLAKMASVSVRTLHYYDQIGLLKPQRNLANNYRHYGKEALLRLQQILFYKEMDFPLEQICAILNDPDFDLVQALESHSKALTAKSNRLQTLIATVDATIDNLKGKNNMTQNDYFKGFSEAEQAEYEKQAAEKWDPATVHESNRKWRSMSKAEQDALLAKGERITLAIKEAMPSGTGDAKVQALVGEWHEYIGNFYPCSLEILSGLGKAYAEQPEFRAFYTRIHPDMPDFLCKAIQIYCKERGLTE